VFTAQKYKCALVVKTNLLSLGLMINSDGVGPLLGVREITKGLRTEIIFSFKVCSCKLAWFDATRVFVDFCSLFHSVITYCFLSEVGLMTQLLKYFKI